MRFGKGTFWTSGAGAGFSIYDFKFSNNIVEAWNGDVLDLGVPIGCSISNNLMEGISGCAVATNGAQGLLVSGNYFEANGRDLDTTRGGWPCRGLAFIGNRTHPKDSKTPSVLWSSVGEGCVSVGNYSGGNLHQLPADANLHIDDFAAGAVWNTPPSSNRGPTAWAPSDASGAGLKFANAVGEYSIATDARLIEFDLELTFPDNASTAPAIIGGLPFPSADSASTNPISGWTIYTDYTSPVQIAGGRGATNFNLYHLATALTNADLSGKTLRMSGRYRAKF
jgi:hypothetical protein